MCIAVSLCERRRERTYFSIYNCKYSPNTETPRTSEHKMGGAPRYLSLAGCVVGWVGRLLGQVQDLPISRQE